MLRSWLRGVPAAFCGIGLLLTVFELQGCRLLLSTLLMLSLRLVALLIKLLGDEDPGGIGLLAAPLHMLLLLLPLLLWGPPKTCTWIWLHRRDTHVVV